jgi:hypothetical protein
MIFLSWNDVLFIGIDESDDRIVPGRFLEFRQYLGIRALDVVGNGHSYEFVGDGFHDDRVRQRTAAEVLAGLSAGDFIKEKEQRLFVRLGLFQCCCVVP